MQISYFNLNLGRRKGVTEALSHLGMLEPSTVPGPLPLAVAGTLGYQRRGQPRGHGLFAAPTQGWKVFLLQHFVSTYYVQDTRKYV